MDTSQLKMAVMLPPWTSKDAVRLAAFTVTFCWDTAEGGTVSRYIQVTGAGVVYKFMFHIGAFSCVNNISGWRTATLFSTLDCV